MDIYRGTAHKVNMRLRDISMDSSVYELSAMLNEIKLGKDNIFEMKFKLEAAFKVYYLYEHMKTSKNDIDRIISEGKSFIRSYDEQTLVSGMIISKSHVEKCVNDMCEFETVMKILKNSEILIELYKELDAIDSYQSYLFGVSSVTASAPNKDLYTIIAKLNNETLLAPNKYSGIDKLRLRMLDFADRVKRFKECEGIK